MRDWPGQRRSGMQISHLYLYTSSTGASDGSLMRREKRERFELLIGLDVVGLGSMPCVYCLYVKYVNVIHPVLLTNVP